ncbi:glycerophosphodiester phosphodiesterase family protein [Salicibibacter halophilus]|uniref:glycerophosphodiester phosphodiesterase family protein n=1 Tax=Salicibibacter halophilus TaxID=2502791 RepID=UPI00221F8A27|nr:glycerophosphodiester phosphodiesterase family protein [Salicibibacter halophilus]
MEEQLVETVEDHGLVEEGNVVIQSFSQESLQTMHDLNDDIPLVQLLWWEEENGELEEWMDITPQPDEMTEENFKEIGEYAVGIGPHLETDEGTQVLDEAFIEKTQNQDLLIHVYTINDQAEMKQLLDWGVDGILTDFPDRLHAVLEDQEKE